MQMRKFICTGILAEKIDEMIEEKNALADLVIIDDKGWLADDHRTGSARGVRMVKRNYR